MANNDKRWSGRSRGGSFGYGFFIFLMNVFGIRAAYAFLSLHPFRTPRHAGRLVL